MKKSLIQSVAATLRNPDQVFFGWWTVLASAITCTWGYSLINYNTGSYTKPLQDEFGWTRAQIAGAAALQRLEGGLEGPFGGLFTDKYGPRAVAFLGILVAGVSLCLVFFVTSLWSYYLIWTSMCLGFSLCMYPTLDVAIANWFVKKRGFAFSIMRTIVAIGCTVLTPFMAFLIIEYGWRMASVIIGLVLLAIGLPLTWFFVRPRRAEYYGLLPDGASYKVEAKDSDSMIRLGQELAAKETGEVEFTLRQAMRTRSFWIQIISNLLTAFLTTSITVHGIPHLINIGIDPVTAASILGFSILVGIPGRLIGGPLLDRASIRHLKYGRMFADALMAVGLFLFMTTTNLPLIYTFIGVYGLGYGIQMVTYPQIRARFFGRKAYGIIGGVWAMIGLPMGVFTPIYIGWIYDTTRSYTGAFTQAIALTCVAIFVEFFLTPPKPPEVVSDVKKIV